MAIVSAIQEAQKDNLKSFNDYMMKVMEVSALLWVHVMFFNPSFFLSCTQSSVVLTRSTNSLMKSKEIFFLPLLLLALTSVWNSIFDRRIGKRKKGISFKA